jgi:hypothetical protein
MPVIIVCAECQRKLKVATTLRGQSIKCPKCGARTRVPAGSPGAGRDSGEAPKRSAGVLKAKALPAEDDRLNDDDDAEDEARLKRVRSRSHSPDDDFEDEDEDRPARRSGHKQKQRAMGPAPMWLRIVAMVLVVITGLISVGMGTFLVFRRMSDIDYVKTHEGEVKLAKALADSLGGDAKKEAERLDIAVLSRELTAAWLMVASIIVVVGACVAVAMSRGWIGGLAMLVAPIPPACLAPITLVFTFPLFLGAIPCFFAWRRRARRGG